jgi:hypothetical protein
MRRGPNEDADIALVEELIFAPRGLALRRFAREETLATRTPDFRVFQNDELVGFCEVKSPRDDWLDDQLDIAPPGQIVGGARPDPTFNRISRHVEKAASQFDAVNPDKALFNVLVFVNHDDTSCYADLRETLTGMFYANDGTQHPTMMHIAEGRIREAKHRIDLYVWINAKGHRIEGHIVNEADPERVQAVCRLLVLNPKKIDH